MFKIFILRKFFPARSQGFDYGGGGGGLKPGYGVPRGAKLGPKPGAKNPQSFSVVSHSFSKWPVRVLGGGIGPCQHKNKNKNKSE